jgi:hypothetical protein
MRTGAGAGVGLVSWASPRVVKNGRLGKRAGLPVLLARPPRSTGGHSPDESCALVAATLNTHHLATDLSRLPLTILPGTASPPRPACSSFLKPHRTTRRCPSCLAALLPPCRHHEHTTFTNPACNWPCSPEPLRLSSHRADTGHQLAAAVHQHAACIQTPPGHHALL